jgi:hypothetical protein
LRLSSPCAPQEALSRPKDSPMNRFQSRYGAPERNPRECSTPTCHNTAANLAGRCWKCANNLRRFADCLQEVPLDSELAPFIRRAEQQRGRYKNLDLDVLEAQYRAIVDSCRGRATPSFKEHGKLSFNVTDRESPSTSQLNKVAEAMGVDVSTAIDRLNTMNLGVRSQFTALANSMGVDPDAAANWIQRNRGQEALSAARGHILGRNLRSWAPLIKAYQQSGGR